MKANISKKSENKAFKAGIWYIISTFMNRAIAVFLTPVLTRMLSEEEYGNFANFSAWCNLLLVITSLDMGNIVVRAKYDFEKNYDEYLSSVSAATIVSTSSVYLIVRIFQPSFENLFGMDNKYINIMFLYLLFTPVYNYFSAQQRVLLKYKMASCISVLYSLITVVLSIVLVNSWEDKLLGRTIGYVAPAFLVGIVIYGVFFYKGRKVVWHMIKYTIFLSIPLIPHNLSNGILAASDKIIIKKYCPVEHVAYYSLGYSVSTLVTLFHQSINKSYAPWLFDQLSKNRPEGIKKIATTILFLFLFMTIGVLFLAPEILLFFGGSKYAASIEVMPAIIVGCMFQFAYSFYVSFEHYLKQTFIISIGTLTAAGINLILNIIFVPILGYTAAAYTTLIGYMVLYFIHFLFVKRTIYKDVLNNRAVFIMTFGCIPLIPIFIKMYQYNIVRWVLISFYILISIALIFTIVKKSRNTTKH